MDSTEKKSLIENGLMFILDYNADKMLTLRKRERTDLVRDLSAVHSTQMKNEEEALVYIETLGMILGYQHSEMYKFVLAIILFLFMCICLFVHVYVCAYHFVVPCFLWITSFC